MKEPTTLSSLLNAPSQARSRAAVMHELRRLLPAYEGSRREICTKFCPSALPPLDSHLEGGLGRVAPCMKWCPRCRRLYRPPSASSRPFLARISAPFPLVFVMPAYARRQQGRLSGHGLNALGLDPARLILVETAHRKETLWAMAEALRSAAPAAVAGMIDKLDLKTSQKLHLAASDAGLPLLLLRPAPTLEASAAATRWRIGTAEAARDRFGLYARPRWHLQLERCSQRTAGRMGSGVRSCRASFQSGCRAGRSSAFSRRKRSAPQAKSLASRSILSGPSSLLLPAPAARASPP